FTTTAVHHRGAPLATQARWGRLRRTRQVPPPPVPGPPPETRTARTFSPPQLRTSAGTAYRRKAGGSSVCPIFTPFRYVSSVLAILPSSRRTPRRSVVPPAFWGSWNRVRYQAT